MKPSFRKAFEAAGVDTTCRPSETSATLARDELHHARVNCELIKARSLVRAKMIVQRGRNK